MQPFMDEFLDRLQVGGEDEAIEVAAGTGVLTTRLARRAKSVLATDFAPKMVEVLREVVAKDGLTNVSIDVMNGQALKVEDKSFDRAACCFGLMFFPDRGKGFSELRRALRPGGRAMVSGWAGPDKFEGFALFLGALKSAFPDLPPPPAPPPVFNLADLADFKAQMKAAGFTNVEVDYVTRDLELKHFDDLWAMMTVGAPPVKMLFDKVGDAGKERVRDALAGIVTDRFGTGPIRVTNSATVGCGTAP